MRFGMGIFTGSALLIHRLEITVPAATLALIDAAGDELELAITNRDDLASLDPQNMNVLAYLKQNFRMPSSVGFQLWQLPWIADYANLPGGGLLVPANPLFFAMDSATIGAAGVCDLVLYYTVIQLADADWVELVQSLIPVNV